MGIVGGQAVLEGVMMKSGDKVSLAVRTSRGIVIENSTFVSLRQKHKFCNIPILRGIISFVEQLKLSMDILTKSADLQEYETTEEPTKFEKWLNETFGENLVKIAGVIGTFLGLVLAIGMFIMVPTFAAKGIDALTGGAIGKIPVLRSLIEGVIRIIIFVLYIWLVSFMPDIRRTFEYHGAEHKSVACFEKGLELTPENAKTCTRFHPRCGTSFVFVMLILSIIINSFIMIDNTWLRLASKLITIPLVVGLGFEFIKYAGCHNNIFVRILSAPGLAMQRLTTREPDESQLNVALTALEHAIPEEFGGKTDSKTVIDKYTKLPEKDDSENDTETNIENS